MIGYFVAYNIPDFCLAFAFFLAYLHIFGKEMKNYTGDQKSKIRFFDHLSFQQESHNLTSQKFVWHLDLSQYTVTYMAKLK